MVAYGFDQLCWLLAQAETTRQIPPTMRAAVIMALLGIALLGMLLVVIILLGGHWVRRQGSRRRGPVVPPDLVLKKDPPKTVAETPDKDTPSGETFVTDETRG